MTVQTPFWHPIEEKPPKRGRYLMRAPTRDGKLDFFQVGYYEPLTKKQLEEAPEGYKHGFYVAPEVWIQFLTHWAFIPPYTIPVSKTKTAKSTRKRARH